MRSSSPDETFRVGQQLAAEIRPGDVLLLYGGLGAGKTLLTKGIMDGLGYDVDDVTSPSFALVNRYDTRNFAVFHIDLWRLDGERDVRTAVGLDEILEDGRSVIVIEWADRLGEIQMPGQVTKINISGDGNEARTIMVTGPSNAPTGANVW